MVIPIYFNNEILSYLPVYNELSIDWQLMGPHEIKAEIELPGALNCPVNSYIFYKGERFTVNTVPDVNAGKKQEFKYTITFESELYRLYDKKLKHLNNKTFQYYGDLNDYAQLIVENINTIDAGWSVGVCDTVPEKLINFDAHTCRSALDTIAEAFQVEWELNGKVLSFIKQVGNTTSLVFKRGMGNGLYSLGYQYQNDKNIVTRAFGYGSTRNLPQGYRNGATQLMFDGLFLENNVDLYRVKEGDFTSEDIYPKVEGTVTAVSTFDANSTTFTITDSSLTFDLKSNFSSDTPKISFLNGELEGQEFEILDYDHTTKAIKIKVFVDGNNNKLPNATFQAAIGDHYTLFDMFLPTEKVAEAEERLRTATQEWLEENSVPRVVYNLELDPLYARDHNIMLKPGDKVTVIDEELGINNLIRVSSVSYPFKFPEQLLPGTKISVQIANFIPYTVAERIIADNIDNQKEIKVVDRTNAERARRNSLNLKTLQSRIFNPDGSLFTGQDSLVAGMASFGYDSQNFNLNNVTISPNAGADANSLLISAGTLIHRIYKVDGVGYIWTLPLAAFTGLDPAKFYYVYAKCSTTSLSGTWEISETPVSVGEFPGYYAFNLGILYEVNEDGYRDFEFTKGMTYIVGDQITTGRIKSIDNQNYFDLSSGEFNVGDAESGFDWDVTKPATLTIRGALASRIIQVGSEGIVNAGISGITDEGESSIRFWAGSDASGKSTAPLRILDDGSLIARKGKIGNWVITQKGLENIDPDGGIGAYIKQRVDYAVNSYMETSLGIGIDGTNTLMRLTNRRSGAGANKGLIIDVANGTNDGVSLSPNIALNLASGDFIIQGGDVYLEGATKKGFTGKLLYNLGAVTYFLKFSKGILYDTGEGEG